MVYTLRSFGTSSQRINGGNLAWLFETAERYDWHPLLSPHSKTPVEDYHGRTILREDARDFAEALSRYLAAEPSQDDAWVREIVTLCVLGGDVVIHNPVASTQKRPGFGQSGRIQGVLVPALP